MVRISHQANGSGVIVSQVSSVAEMNENGLYARIPVATIENSLFVSTKFRLWRMNCFRMSISLNEKYLAKKYVPFLRALVKREYWNIYGLRSAVLR